ncbi:sporulation protein [Caloranaerobacter azorensis H53214]|uniref:Sporulation protein YqfC n=2 Tax=Caloranaerobacter azorensis TaxID=116090 RepID=A0A1M5S8N2_9FIRM|nr:sporulation protein YqfC [Caloranaerobacter azorensis]KGG80151.1 sporulation protein [Caloranaerobacter azorensis H53214]SHH34628.1 sporulation protein YqfC [Caloranaerobacter azorensis DSM 13643]
MKKRVDDIKSTISDVLELPKDIVLDLPRITLIGNLQLYIENHKGIIEYSKQRIRINTNIGILRIVGNNLTIRTIVTEEIIIVGEIEVVEFIS